MSRGFLFLKHAKPIDFESFFDIIGKVRMPYRVGLVTESTLYT